jgi:hypothetical protein
MMTSLSLRGKLIQLMPDDSEDPDDVTVFLDVMRGRVNLSVLSRERWLIVRFDGWPEVRAGLPDGIFSNQKSKFGLILKGLAMEDVGIFNGHLFFRAI